MIEILPQSTDTTLAVHFSGEISGQEYQQFLDALEPHLKSSGQVNLVCDLAGVQFYGDLDAAKKDFAFGFGDYGQIHRAAFVGDQKWIELFTRLIGPFTHVEEKHFPAGQLEEAFTWASARS